MEPAHLRAVEIRSAATHHRSVNHDDLARDAGACIIASAQEGSSAPTRPAEAGQHDNGYGWGPPGRGERSCPPDPDRQLQTS